ncbi:MAG: TPM domain-containing protein [bacterium]|nr:TPM domain-containing protein [bacterium]
MVKENFSLGDQDRIVSAIKDAETATSGEIRVHIEAKSKLEAFDRAKEVFIELGMGKTELKNGVLIYLALDDRKFAIIGDSGIHEKVGEVFWLEEKNLMAAHFIKGEFAIGISMAIEKIGEKLKKHFPYQSDDTNELSNDISFGDGNND